MLQTTVCCNTPSWFSMLFKMGKVFMSSKTLDKFKVCPRKGKIEVIRRRLVVFQRPHFLPFLAPPGLPICQEVLEDGVRPVLSGRPVSL